MTRTKKIEEEEDVRAFTEEEIRKALNHEPWDDPDLLPWEDWNELKRHQRRFPELYGLPPISEEERERRISNQAPPGVYVTKVPSGKWSVAIWNHPIDRRPQRKYVGVFEDKQDAINAGVAKQDELKLYPPLKKPNKGSVYANKGKWTASIKHKGLIYHIGTFPTKEAAIEALDKKRDELDARR